MVKVADAFVEIRPDTKGFQSEAERGISGPLKGIAAAAAAAFAVDKIKDFATASVSAASDLAESTSKVGVVFGAARAQILEFGETSATSVGLAKQEALEAAGTFGNLFTALGLSKDAAATMSPEIVQLGADLASFNNLGVPETLEKIRSGLVGEVEPLRSLGISFDAATVEAKALELGLADANGEVNEAGKVQARLKLIMEQTTAAQGDFARTSDGLANQQRILSAEWKDMQASIGQALLPTILEMVDIGRDRLVPFIERAAKSSVPLFTSAIRAGVPIAESLMTTFEAGLPILEGFASVIEAMPPELVSTVASFVALRSALGPVPNLLQSITGAKGLDGLRSGAGTAAIALTGLVAVVGYHAQKRAEEQARIEAVTAALEDNTQANQEALEALLADRLSGFNEDLVKLGITVGEVAFATQAGTEDFDAFVDSLAAAPDAAFGVDKVRTVLEGVREEVQRGAEEALIAKVANAELSGGLLDMAISATTATDGTVNWIAALGIAEEQQRAAAGELNRFQTAADLAAESTVDLGEVLETAEEEADSFKTAIEELLSPLLAQEDASLRAAQAVADFTRELKEGRQENEPQADFMRRIARSTNDLIEAQLGAATSSRDATERLVELGRRFPEVQEKVNAMVTAMSRAGQEVGPAGRMIAQAFINGIVDGLRDGEGRVRQSADAVARIVEGRAAAAGGAGRSVAQGLTRMFGAPGDADPAAGLISAVDARDELRQRLAAATTAEDIADLHRQLISAQQRVEDAAESVFTIGAKTFYDFQELARRAGLSLDQIGEVTGGVGSTLMTEATRLIDQLSSDMGIDFSSLDDSGAARRSRLIRELVEGRSLADIAEGFAFEARGAAGAAGGRGGRFEAAEVHLVIDLQKDGKTERVFDGAAPSGQKVRTLVKSA